MENNLTNLAGLANTLRLSRDWLKSEADEGRIPSLKVGRKRLFNIQTVSQILSERAATQAYRKESDQ